MTKEISEFEKDFFTKVKNHFPYLYKNKEYQFNFEKFCLTFPKTSEKIVNEILKDRQNTNSRECVKKINL